MSDYNFKETEAKWQSIWEKENRYKAVDFDASPKYYILVEFPYPSGYGLHVGHTPNQIAMDIMARFKRAQGYNVLYPIGWDSFGLPTENFAILKGRNPKDITKENVAYFKKQIKSLGISFDWSREVATTDESYYKWTQWLFLQFFKHGMAYKATANINWCPKCKIGLSNEESEGGVCERCGAETVQKPKSQWMLKMTDYAQKLLDGLDETDYLESIKRSQIEWIGKSEGVEVEFITNVNEVFSIYTTCIETIFGITYMVLAPEHPLVSKLKNKIQNWNEVENYIAQSARKAEFDRLQLNFEKTGCELVGILATNPMNNEQVKVYISDYVLANYGTGAVMAVPAHDQRDYEFAQKLNLPVKEVITGGNIQNSAWAKENYLNSDCALINSAEFSGLDITNAKVKITEKLVRMGIGQKKVNFNLRDWVFSRQRYWGEPVPLIHCEKHGWVAVPDEQLPVVLPHVEKYTPTDDGESPLAKMTDWVNTTCPVCGAPAKRETDVMPNWAGSSWYWLRYMDPHNDKEFANFEKMKYWGQVDIYNGGGEHVTRHLLYARFWHKFFYDIGLVPTSEPFKRRIQQGLILASDGTKMSKSRGNVVNPMKYVEKYGADTSRIAQMFMGDYIATKPWSDETIKPAQKLLQRVWEISKKVKTGEIRNELKYDIHYTIKNVTEDILNLKFNTAISLFIVLSKEFENQEYITSEEYKILLKLINPFAPHITEEIWEKCCFAPQIEKTPWPAYDEKALIKDEIEVPVQINGKLRGVVLVKSDATKEEILDSIKQKDEIYNYFKDSVIKKIIYVPNRIFNIVF